MPRRYKSTAVKNKRRIAKAKPTAANQKKQIASAQNQIVAIKKHMNLTKPRIRWHCGFTDLPMTSYPLIIPLTSGPSQTNPAVVNSVIGLPLPWVETFTPSPQDAPTIRSKVVVNKQYVDMTVKSNTENAPLSFTAFIVQLQEKVARQTYVDTSSMSTMVRGTDYITPLNSVSQDSGYGAFINSSRYRIIKRLEFETLGGASGGAAGSTGNTGQGTRTGILHRAQAKLNYGSTLLKSAGAGASSQTLNYDDVNPEQKRFIVVFSDNSLLDLQYPSISVSCLTTGYSADL